MTDTLVTPIVSWRLWHLTYDGTLRSLNEFSTVWEPRKQLTATCVKNDSMKRHETPETTVHPACTCGIWGYKTLDELVKADVPDCAEVGCACGMRVWASYARPQIGRLVLGQVYLWGRVMEHKHGYRAEFACVKRLHRVLQATNEGGTPVITDWHEVEPEIETKWRHEEGVCQISGNSSEKLESSLFGLLSWRNPPQSESILPPHPQNHYFLHYRSVSPTLYQSPNWTPRYHGQVVYVGPVQLTAPAQTAPVHPLQALTNRSVPKGQEAAVKQKEEVAKDPFWNKLSGLRNY